MNPWAVLTVFGAGFLVARNASQRGLTAELGVLGATYSRFLYGVPFALVWTAGIVAWRGMSGGPSAAFFSWIMFASIVQWAATAFMVVAMNGRAFAVATAFTKTEVAGSAMIGMFLIHDHFELGDWIGIGLGTLGMVSLARVSMNREALNAAIAGLIAGALFSFSSVSYRAAAHEWGGDGWVGAAAALFATLIVQTLFGALLMIFYARPSVKLMFSEWRQCLVPGACGAMSSALIFTAFSIGPSTGAVKAVQLVDVIIAMGVSRHLRERMGLHEVIGIALILTGALAVVL